MKKITKHLYKKIERGDKINIGFTGTRFGMSKKQQEAFAQLIDEMEIREFHHGDCIGADEEAHEILRENKPQVKIFVHPPLEERNRAFCKGDFLAPKKEYLKRDSDIVAACNKLIATPKEKNEVIRSGTWTTIRYAKKSNKSVVIIYPNGEIENNGKINVER